MNACDVIAYTYNADYHCAECAIERFGEHPASPTIHRWCRDDVKDADGNAPQPVFADSEWWDAHQDATFPQSLACGTCGHTIAIADDGITYP